MHGLLHCDTKYEGKKKLAKESTIKVRLLTDIPRYGRQGTIIPIPAGRMRNDFYPKKLAEYMTKSQLREIGMDNVAVERDSNFGIAEDEAPIQEEEEAESSIAVDLDLLRPERALKVMSLLLPNNIDFYRTTIATPPPSPPRHSPSIPPSSAISAAALEGAQPEEPERVGIYGSVSTADIAANLRAILAENDEGSRIVLSPEDITFVKEVEDKDRVKHLGTFEIDIRLKGADGVVRRTISVNAQN